MKWWLKLRKRRSLDRDLEEEIAFHRAMRSVDDDAPPFGNPTLIKENARDMWTFGWIEILFQDTRYALRGLLRNKGFTLTALLLLALAIGANTAMFTVVKRVLLDPLPYPGSDRLVRIWQFHKQHASAFSVTALDYLDWASQAKSFDGMAAYNGRGMTITGEGEPELFIGLTVSANFFRVLGVSPALGRDFLPEENEKGRDRVLILRHAFWQRKFGGDPGVIGRTVRLNGEAYQVIGVMPPSFAFPETRYDAWAPHAFRGGDPQWTNRSAHYLRVFGRLKPSANLTTATAEMEGIAAQLEQTYPDTNRNEGVQLRMLKEWLVGDAQALVLLLYGAVTVLLLIACSNLAGLFIARSAARRTEFTTRSALGASRPRLMVQMIVESGILCAMGGIAGLGLAYALILLLKAYAPDTLPRVEEIGLDPAILGFSFALTLVTSLLFGLAPAAGVSRLTEAARGAAARGLRHRMRSALVVVQVALAVLLLSGAGLFVRSFHNLSRVDKGFDTEGVLTTNLVLMENEYPSPEKLIEFGRQLDERLATTPGVIAAGFTTALPLSGQGWRNPVAIEERPVPPGGKSNLAAIQCVSPRYLPAIHAPLKVGRHFTDGDHAKSQPVAMVDETFVRAFLSEGDPIGKRIKVGDADSTAPWLTVVGVAGTLRQFSLDGVPEPHVFLPYAQLGALAPIAGRGLYVAVRSSAVESAAGMVKARIAELDSMLPLRETQLFSERVDTALAPQRFRTALMGGFAVLALLLAGVGLYGVIAFTVAQRTQEIGVRMALGAQVSQIVGMVVSDGARLGALGAGLGIAASLALSRVMENMLFGVGSRDGATLIAAALILGAVILLASYLPARRAGSVDPMRALRTE